MAAEATPDRARKSRRFIINCAEDTNGDDLKRTGISLEARVGIEPTHKGFADLSLTTWVPRPKHAILIQKGNRRPAQIAPGRLERETGLEPATLALARRCSTTELLPHGSF